MLFDTYPLVLFRSSPHSQRRLSDLMVGVDVGDMGLGLEGRLDDMIAPEFEDIGMPQQEGALDRRPEATGEPIHCAISLTQKRVSMHMCMSHDLSSTEKTENPMP